MRKWLQPISTKLVYYCIVLSAVAALLTFTNSSRFVDRLTEDVFYQDPVPLDGNVVVVGITAEDLDRFGKWPWDRAVLAQTVEQLNAEKDSRPAAIGVDVMFSSNSGSESDRRLVDACSAENVVTACSVNFDTLFTFNEDGSADVDDFGVASVILPFAELAAVAPTGHVNAMYDSDGVLRHHLWSVPDGSGGELMSMPWLLYQRYCKTWGLTADFDPPRSAQGFWYVEYSSLPGGYFEYSVSDIYDGDFDTQTLAGAVVLIGPWDTGLSDDFVTSVDHAERMYGVEYLANVLRCMIDGRAVQEVGRAGQLVVLGFFTLVISLLFFSLNLRIGAMLYLLSCLGSVGACMAAWYQGYLLHLLWPMWACTLGFLSCIVQHYWVAQREKRFIRTTFEHYVDPGILNELLKEGSDALGLHGKTADVAVLFVDVRGFTSLSEILRPEQVVQLLNRYLTLTSDCVFQNCGTLDKFVGDCTMAFWGAPLPCADAVGQACQAAMDMVRGAEALSQALETEFGYTLKFGVGVHFGEAVVGNIGSTKRMDYTVIGDVVNTASRLESNAPPDCVYISALVRQMLGDRAVARRLEKNLHLKGKAVSVEVYQLLEMKERDYPQSLEGNGMVSEK